MKTIDIYQIQGKKVKLQKKFRFIIDLFFLQHACISIHVTNDKSYAYNTRKINILLSNVNILRITKFTRDWMVRIGIMIEDDNGCFVNLVKK